MEHARFWPRDTTRRDATRGTRRFSITIKRLRFEAIYHIRFRSEFRSIRFATIDGVRRHQRSERSESESPDRQTGEESRETYRRRVGKSAYLHLMRTTPLCSSSISRRRMFLAMIYSRNALPLSPSFSLTRSLHHHSECIRRTAIALPHANS